MNSEIFENDIHVAVRLRPALLSGSQHEECRSCFEISPGKVTVAQHANLVGHRTSWAFDEVMDSSNETKSEYVSQRKCYEVTALRMIGHALWGYHTSLVCYGHRGSGKTETMMGKLASQENWGLLPRFLQDYFQQLGELRENGSKVLCSMQMVEILNNQVQDLIGPPATDANRQHPEIRVHPTAGVYIADASNAQLNSWQEGLHWLGLGLSRATQMEAPHGRSNLAHTVVRLSVKAHGPNNSVLESSIHFADLAGADRQLASMSGANPLNVGIINKELLFLNMIIHDLVHEANHGACQRAMANFSNSKLTLLLSDAFIGSCKSSFVCHIRPEASGFHESLDTLRFAANLKKLQRPAASGGNISKDAMIKALTAERMRIGSEMIEKQLQEGLEVRRREAQLAADDQCGRSGRRSYDSSSSAGWILQRRGELPGFPSLVNFSADMAYTGCMVFHFAEPKRKYTVGFDASSDFILPEQGFRLLDKEISASSSSTICVMSLESDSTVAMEPCCISLLPVAAIEVNKQRLVRPGQVILRHKDAISIGPFQFYLFTHADPDNERLLYSPLKIRTMHGFDTTEIVHERAQLRGPTGYIETPAKEDNASWSSPASDCRRGQASATAKEDKASWSSPTLARSQNYASVHRDLEPGHSSPTLAGRLLQRPASCAQHLAPAIQYPATGCINTAAHQNVFGGLSPAAGYRNMGQ